MAEFRKLPTQQELQQILFMQGLRPQSTQDILQQNLQSQTITPLPENVFQKIAGGARRAGQIVNQAGTAADVAKLFPGYTGQSQVNIPTGFNFAPKQDPMGGVIPQGLQTQQMNVGQLLQAIKPADVLGISGAERAYTDIGQGKAPQPMDVVDTLALGAGGLAGTKAAVKSGVAAAKYSAPKVGETLENYVVRTGLVLPLDAYHGSPYTFERFDISKVGTGEGAQAYGHGIYFAEAPGVARGYQMALSRKAGEETTIGGKPVADVYNKIYDKANRMPVKDAEIEYQKAEMLEKMMLDTPPNELISYAKDIGADPKVIQWLEKDIAPKTKFPGAFYKVDIPDKAIDTFIDWDKPLSEQKDLLDKITPSSLGLEYQQLPNGNHAFVNSDGKPFGILQKGGTKDSFEDRWKQFISMQGSGGDLYKALNQGMSDSAKTSQALNKAGIQGIRYLDQSSRSAGEGTRNFVVFDPSIVKMLERNDKPMQGLLGK